MELRVILQGEEVLEWSEFKVRFRKIEIYTRC